MYKRTKRTELLLGDRKTNPSLEAAEKVYTSIIKISEGHLRYSAGIVTYADAVKDLITKWAPSYTDRIEGFVSTYKKIAELYEELSKVEIRVSDDIRDCNERFYAVDRYAATYNKATEKYREASDDLISAIGDELYVKRLLPAKYDDQKEKLQKEIAKAREVKKTALEEKKKTLKEYIDERVKYNSFKIRRLQHAFNLYSTTLKEQADKEIELYDTISSELESLKESGALPANITSGIESTMPSKEENSVTNETTEIVQEIHDQLETTQEEKPQEEIQEEIKEEEPQEEVKEDPKEEEPKEEEPEEPKEEVKKEEQKDEVQEEEIKKEEPEEAKEEVKEEEQKEEVQEEELKDE